MTQTLKKIYNQIQNLFSGELSKQSCRWLFWAIFCLGIALRIANYFFEPIIARDGIKYIAIAYGWAEHGDGFLFDEVLFPIGNPPLLWGAMRQLWRIGIAPELSGLLLCMACGILIPIVVYRIGKILFNSRELALAAMLIAVCHPTLVELSKEIIRDAPFLLFGSLALWLMLEAMLRSRVVYWIYAGAALGTAVLCRYEALELLLIPALFFGINLRPSQWHETIKGALLLILGLVISFILLTLLLGVPFELYRKIFFERLAVGQ